jgi:transposase-like protein
MALGHVEDARMARKRHTAEEIVAKLRQVDVQTSQGRPVAEAVRAIGVTEVTYYRWRSEYGGQKGARSAPEGARGGEYPARRACPIRPSTR